MSSAGPDDSNNKWKYAVPIGNDEIDGNDVSNCLLLFSFFHHTHLSFSQVFQNYSSSRDPIPQGSPLSKSNNTAYLSPARTQRNQAQVESGVWSENIRKSWDSYEPRASPVQDPDGSETPITQGNKEQDPGNWIHRDKLARIENEELQQAYLMLAQPPHDTSPEPEQLESWPTLDNGSPHGFDGAADDWAVDEGELEDQRTSTSPEVQNREDAAAAIYSNPTMRKSSSRIPIPTSSSSRLPLSPSTPQRSRGLSSGSDSSQQNSSARRQANRPNNNNNNENNNNNSTPNSTPRKTSTSTPTPGRKKSVSRQRNPSTSNGARQRSQSQSHSRPSTANRTGENRPIFTPEGDPPWLANTYKPDPRLPADQQILPTHAKRMQQEQWEKEGQTPMVYDREFAPLAVSPDKRKEAKNNSPKPEQQEEKEGAIDETNGAKSEEPPKGETKDEQISVQPAQQTTTTDDPPISEGKTKTFDVPESNPTPPPASSGYRTIPKVANSQPLGSTRVPMGTVATAAAESSSGQPEIQEPVNEKEPRAKCCCIVM